MLNSQDILPGSCYVHCYLLFSNNVAKTCSCEFKFLTNIEIRHQIYFKAYLHVFVIFYPSCLSAFKEISIFQILFSSTFSHGMNLNLTLESPERLV